MATKSRPAAPKAAAKKPAAKKAKPRAKAAPKAKTAPKVTLFTLPGGASFGDLTKLPNALTTEQAIDLYKANAKLALDIVNAAIDGTARVRRRQFEGEEEARAFQKRAAKSAAEVRDPQTMMAAGQGVAQEAVEKSLRYWTEMFELIVEIQKRLFSLIEDQTAGLPGVKQAKAALAMMPDMSKMQNVVSAMQGVVSSGGPAFESMQKVMSDFARMAQQGMPGIKR
ncbi:MAG: phasin family protein [Betaproteobacteria bacterium]